MTKYLLVYRAPVSAAEQMANTDPEAAQAGMDARMAWSQRAGSAIVDLGSPLQAVSSDGEGAPSAATRSWRRTPSKRSRTSWAATLTQSGAAQSRFTSSSRWAATRMLAEVLTPWLLVVPAN